MSLLALSGTNSVSGGYDIDNSLKFEPDNSEYLKANSTFASTTPTSRKKGTVSFWIKRTEIGNGVSGKQMYIFASSDSSRYSNLGFDEFDNLTVFSGDSSWNGVSPYTYNKFRDTSAWYHIVIRYDTTDSTASNRLRVYSNGTEVSWVTAPNITQDGVMTYSGMNGPCWHSWGTIYSYFTPAKFFSGYLAEAHFVDGQSLAPTEFGETDSDSGIWKPKEYDGTYGNCGYYLDFADSGNLGDDESGNGFDFDENNIAAADQATDTPTNNFCTLNLNTGYIQGSDATTFTQGATTRQGGSSSYNGALGTIGINPFVGSAKWYWEVELSANNSGDGIELGAGWLATSIIQSTTSDKATAGNNAGFQIWTSFNFDPPAEGTGADGDVFGFLLQCDSSNPNLKIYKNDTLFTTRHTATSHDFENDFYFPVVFIYNTGMKAFCNFGNPFDATVSSGNTDPNGYGNFEFDTKSGYALCTKNLEEYG